MLKLLDFLTYPVWCPPIQQGLQGQSVEVQGSTDQAIVYQKSEFNGNNPTRTVNWNVKLAIEILTPKKKQQYMEYE